MTRAALEIVQRAASAPACAASPRSFSAAAPRSSAHGWESFGHYLRAAAMATRPGAEADSRLVRAPTGAGEADLPGGGFLLETDWATSLRGSIYEESELLPLVDRRPTAKPADVRLPAVNETSRATGSRWGGVQSFWEEEGVQPPETFPRFRSLAFTARKLVSLMVCSRELLSDVPALESHVRRVFASEAAWMLENAVIAGSGSGQFLGILAAPCTITVPKQAGQASGTIVAENVTAMWQRLAGPLRRSAVWVGNEDCEAQLAAASVGTPAAASGMYYPAGFGGNPFPLVCGRPLLISESCPVLGQPGDLILAAPREYIMVDGGLEAAMSLDVLWLSDQPVFLIRWRGDGKPAWPSPITPYNGGATRSPFVICAQR